MMKFFTKRSKPLSVVVALMVSLTFSVSGQSGKTATGKVVGVDGNPLVGVTVTTTSQPVRGVSTDNLGNFTLNNVAEGEVLVFSFIGMETREIVFAGEPLNVVLSDDTFSMDEILVVAYGTQTRSSFTGSAAVVSAADIANRPVTNVMSALEGMASGIQMQSTSGAPGSVPEFRIRGASSINAGKDPLVVVDGVPFESGMNNINPNDVESITILKDAASTAIYGARGGNGVILITTKRGTSGKAVVSFDANFSIQKRRNSDLYDVIEDPGEYYELHYDALYNYYTNLLNYDSSEANRLVNQLWLKAADEGGLGYQVYTLPTGENLIGYNGKLNPNATLGRVTEQGYYMYPDNWRKETYSLGYRQDYNLSVSGGTEAISLMATAGYTKEDGITPNSGYERFTGRLKASYKAKNWFRLRANIDVAVSDQDATYDYSNNSNNVFSNANRIAPIYPVYVRDAEGNLLYDENGVVYDYGDGTYNEEARPISAGSNRIQEAKLQTRHTSSVKTGAQGGADFFITPDITATFNVGYEERNRRYKTTGQPFYGTSNPGGNVYVYSYKNQLINLQQLVNYSKKFGEHNVQATLLHEFYKYQYYYLYATKSNMFSYFDNQELAGAITLNNANSYSQEYQSEGFGGRVMYDYKGIYYFDASYRRDASSRFHPDHRWGNFFSFGAGYLISREDFFHVSWIDALKLKFSVGQNGNDNIGSSYRRYEDNYEIENTNGEMALAFYSRGNKNITWETRTATNAGIEFQLFNRRLTGEIEYYNNKTTNMLAQVSVPYSLGYSSYWDNVGSMRNRGFELELRGEIIRKKDFNFSLYANASFNKSKVLTLAEERTGNTLYNIDGKAVAKGYSSDYYFYGEDLEYRTWYLKKFAGVNDEGLSTWYVLDEQTGEISTTTTYSSASYFDCGSSQAKVLGGFGGRFNWKDLELSFAFSYRLGGYAYDSGYATLMTAPYSGRTGYNYHKDVYKSWTPSSQSNEYPRWQYNDLYFTSPSDRWLTKANYLNFQNITVGYSLPSNFVNGLGVDQVILSFGVDNVCFISKRQGFIPTRDFDGDLDLGYHPDITRFVFNLSFKF